jgi:hypothetical protein
MKTILPLALLIAGATVAHASIMQEISLDLSSLNPGSTLSGTFTLPDSPASGDTAPVVLTFSDPANYSPTSVASTITVFDGTPSGFAVSFSNLTFTNLNGRTTPINTRDVSLSPFAFANCTSFPCTASGLFEDRSPAVFTAAYTISPVTAAPEPAYALLLPVVFMLLFVTRQRIPARNNLLSPHR